VPLWFDDVPFWTVSVGLSVPSCSPLTGDTAVGAVSVTAPEPPLWPDGAVGPTGTCRGELEPLPHAVVNTKVRINTGNRRINRSVVMYEPRYFNNNCRMVNFFIENRRLR
jgi:hypothetical protein